MKSGMKINQSRVLSPSTSSDELPALRSDNRLTLEPKHYILEWHHTSHPARGRRRLSTESLPERLGLEQRLQDLAAARRRSRRSSDRLETSAYRHRRSPPPSKAPRTRASGNGVADVPRLGRLCLMGVYLSAVRLFRGFSVLSISSNSPPILRVVSPPPQIPPSWPAGAKGRG